VKETKYFKGDKNKSEMAATKEAQISGFGTICPW